MEKGGELAELQEVIKPLSACGKCPSGESDVTEGPSAEGVRKYTGSRTQQMYDSGKGRDQIKPALLSPSANQNVRGLVY